MTDRFVTRHIRSAANLLTVSARGQVSAQMPVVVRRCRSASAHEHCRYAGKEFPDCHASFEMAAECPYLDHGQIPKVTTS